MTSRKGIFSPYCSLENEMKEFSEYMKNSNESGKEIFQSCNELVELAASGQYRKFCSLAMQIFRDVEILDENGDPRETFHPPVTYFGLKALLAALCNHHWLIATFILDNGYPINKQGLPNIISSCIDSGMVDEDIASIVDLLSSKKFDFNQQVPPTYYAPLHYSIKARLVETTKRLIGVGADVNIVADKDVMPLPLAMEVKAIESDPRIEEIIDILMRSGARMTWRKDANKKATVKFSSAFLFSTEIVEEEDTQQGFGTSHVTSTSIRAGGQNED